MSQHHLQVTCLYTLFWVHTFWVMKRQTLLSVIVRKVFLIPFQSPAESGGSVLLGCARWPAKTLLRVGAAWQTFSKLLRWLVPWLSGTWPSSVLHFLLRSPYIHWTSSFFFFFFPLIKIWVRCDTEAAFQWWSGWACCFCPLSTEKRWRAQI